MKVRTVLTTSVIATCLILCLPSLAFAGNVEFRTQPGSPFLFICFSSTGSIEFLRFIAETPGDGVVFEQIPLPNQGRTAITVTIMVSASGRPLEAIMRVIPGSLPLLEPFEVPTFSAADPNITLTSDMDLNAFLAEGNPFTVGQTFSVVHGITPLTQAITFTDQSGNLFSGTVTVEPFGRFNPIPEPATMLLLGTGLAGVAMKMRKRLKSRKSG